ncbi:putative late blight resistance protein homolog R1C-3 [Solanum dulcamara]|uniref:putative late blight resistance protein homolog R1C-3 n=1 Tax=Solanum dulcamara TaxID=45834 RepID=UPI0024867A6F|nr:putative late blight resistance protein homolog R1C-3 [Solanum dulcamara]
MAYAAITSLMRTIRQSMELIGCDLQPFYKKLESLRAILEKSCNITGDLEALTSLEAEIAEVAYTTEDTVDSESRNIFLAQNLQKRSRAMWELFFLLELALECIDSTMEQWMAISDSMKDLKLQTYSLASLPDHVVEPAENIMVGHETEFEMMLDQLARGERELEVVSIVGMGGIGKTTLATKLYSDRCIMSRFDIRAKVTVSQEYCARNVLLGLLSSISDEPDDQLADQLQKLLKGKRYLVVIDDIWTTEAWDDIKLCFPDCNNGSRILLTTRNVEVAEYASSEDERIHVNKLVELWVVEGFLNEEEGKSIEDVAKTCINELIDRSLIFIRDLSFCGTIEICGMHDVIRELCLREARNMNFVNVIGKKSDQNSCAQSMLCSFKSRSRISIHNEEGLAWCRNSEAHSIIMMGGFKFFTLELSFKLVRVLDLSMTSCEIFPSGIHSLIHLRYLALSIYPRLGPYPGSSYEAIPLSLIDMISSLCYLQTLKLYPCLSRFECPFILPSEILTMPQLRNLHLAWNYLRNHELTEKCLVLKNLQYLRGLNPRYCTGSFLRLFPNLKRLQIFGVQEDFLDCKYLFALRYLYELEKLEFGNLRRRHFRKTDVPMFLPPPDAFPPNLKNLTFNGNFVLAVKELSIVGKLPKLEVLELSNNAFKGNEWEVVEEGFPRLKFLFLNRVHIQYWRASSDHFPYLERLFLRNCRYLDSIPQDFADITTLALIDIRRCQQSVGNSAKQIQQHIQDNYGSSIEVHTHDLF